MKRSSIVWIVVVVIIVVAGIWFWSASMSSPSASTAGTSTTTPSGSTGAPTIPAQGSSSTTPSTVVLNTGSTSTLGTYLVAPNGMTLYMDMSDKAGASSCTGTCATVWPPYTISTSIASSLLGGTPGIPGIISTITRADGSLQITYNNKPLYFYEKDTAVGDVKGQNVGGFMVVAP